jgi:alpha-beta hydrolase superfamily lysophospholipase
MGRWIAALVAALGASVLICAWILGSELTASRNHAVMMPSGFHASTVSIRGNGHEIAGWWVDQGADSPVVLLLHAVRADRSSMVGRANLLLSHGYSVLLIDLQGQGETPGEHITFGWLESRDVTSALMWLREQAPGRRVGAIGCSLGGASILLRKDPTGFDAVVLEAVYPRLNRAVRNRVHLRVGFLEPLFTPLLLAQLEPRLKISPRELEPISGIARLGAPVLVAAGSSDEHTTLQESQELFATAKAPKDLWLVSGARHQDLLRYDPVGYQEHVIQFLDAGLKR